MKFLIDENIRSEITDFLKSLQYDVTVVATGTKDDKVARIAKDEKRILITHDVDFSNILLYPPEELSGIIRIKIQPPTASIIIKALNNLFEKIPPAKMEKRLIILEKDNFRVR